MLGFLLEIRQKEKKRRVKIVFSVGFESKMEILAVESASKESKVQSIFTFMYYHLHVILFLLFLFASIYPLKQLPRRRMISYCYTV